MIIDHPVIQWISKGWGGEKVIDNRKEYCGKILYIIKDKSLSVHYHNIKTETFLILKGKILIRYYDSVIEIEEYVKEHGKDNIENKLNNIILEEGDTFLFFQKGFIKLSL